MTGGRDIADGDSRGDPHGSLRAGSGRAPDETPDVAGDLNAAKGADLAREALDAAKARNAAARNAAARAGKRTGGSGAAAAGVSRRLQRRRWSGPGTDRARDPQLLADTVGSWLSAAGAGREVVKASVFARWADIVGADIAAHAAPVSLVDGELVLQAESTAWATQLRLLAPGMITKINAAVGRGTVTRIRTRGPAGPSWRFGNRHVPGRGPRDTYG